MDFHVRVQSLGYGGTPFSIQIIAYLKKIPPKPNKSRRSIVSYWLTKKYHHCILYFSPQWLNVRGEYEYLIDTLMSIFATTEADRFVYLSWLSAISRSGRPSSRGHHLPRTNVKTSSFTHEYYETLSAFYSRTRQIIRYQSTATLRRPKIKQYTASNEGGGLQNQRQHHIILTKYVVVHPMAFSENYSLSGMLTIFDKSPSSIYFK